MIEKIQCLESSIPNGCVFQDADTLLADYMGWDIGNEGTGITKKYSIPINSVQTNWGL